ncbi:DUF2244 domain-containing protein [Thalassovita taeanensis]|uniref:Uncharacterized membrane protein n=1 Tax=Thalassovita taeanensis TaxID=657014 RepID=A0A1H9EVN3_9RHOB|nr:DUF2244 domain-containing protein [Thalassovita taeanensis]SEQ29770.1 Uncharacterized membrane protein [Thalassovita taeanensis]
MPYQWTSPQALPRSRQLTLWPHRSLPRKGFAVVILATFTLITIPLYPLLGTVFLWGLLPFLMLVVAGLWWGLERSYRDGRVLEVLTLTPETAHLIRTNPKGDTQDWTCNTYWARSEMHMSGGPVPYYVTLTGNGRTVEIGAFLSEDERRQLYGELAEELKSIADPETPRP